MYCLVFCVTVTSKYVIRVIKAITFTVLKRVTVQNLLQMMSQLEKASQPVLTSLTVEWTTFKDDMKIRQAPCQIMSLFNGERQVVYGFVDNCTQVRGI